MRVLVIGSGGRENAIAWKISKSPLLTALFCAPGNPGTSELATNLDIDITNFSLIKEVVLSNKIEMVVVGPEEPLVKGLGDFFKDDPLLNELAFIGPCKNGAMLEGSKDFAKSFMERHNIPTSAYKSFNSGSINEACNFIDTLKPPYVIKADGLAAGKGVVICESSDEAKREIQNMLQGKFGQASSKIVIEEFLHGIELSIFVLTDGSEFITLPEAKDYKRVFDGDKGANTGGMGAVSPVPFADAEFMDRVRKRVVIPTIEGLKRDGIDYKGFIFIGLMNCLGDPYVIEYNVRMGDPETEAVMPRIKSDLLSHFIALSKGRLSEERFEAYNKSSLTLVMVSGGYPGEYKKGLPIEINKSDSDCHIFHCGTKQNSGELVTNGGRVFAITALCEGFGDNSILTAREEVYKVSSAIQFQEKFFRNDIGLDLLSK